MIAISLMLFNKQLLINKDGAIAEPIPRAQPTAPLNPPLTPPLTPPSTSPHPTTHLAPWG